nr:class I SAM-dependent methyltransferase [Rhizobium sp. ACO-34A]
MALTTNFVVMPRARVQEKNLKTVCNLCGSDHWRDMNGRIGVLCQKCGSLERTRAIKLVLDKVWQFSGDERILHIAPEKGLYDFFRTTAVKGYEPVDYDPESYAGLELDKFDLVADAPRLPYDCYDLIIHSHVLEHVRCNIAHVFFHLTRALKPNGLHIFCLPLMEGYYEEDLGPLSEGEALRRFGQSDHVRRFGIEDLDRHLGLILKIQSEYSLYDYADVTAIASSNIPPSERSGLNGSTVFVTRKSDYLLQ